MKSFIFRNFSSHCNSLVLFPRAFIDELFLKQEFRNRGLGKLILESVEFYAIKHEVNAIHLEVEQSNEAANKLYLKTGFSESDRSLLTKTLN